MFNEKFWLAISFFSFIGLIIKFVWPKISKSLDEKSKKIAETILEARKLKESAEEFFKKAELFYQQSITKSEQIIKDAESEAKKIEVEAQENLSKEIKKRTEIALERIKSEEESAIRQIKSNIVSTTINQLSSDLSFNNQQHNKLNEKSIKNIEAAITNS